MNKNKIIMKMISFIITFIYSSYIFAEDNKKCQSDYSTKKIEYIKQKYIIDKKYFVKDNKTHFKKILVGEWAALPHSRINFNENGTFVLIYQTKDKREGRWDISNNCILLKFKNEVNYNCIEIEYFILSYNSGTYIFEIVFKNDQYWGGELYLEFN